MLSQECTRAWFLFSQCRGLHENEIKPLRYLFGRWLPLLLYSFDKEYFFDQSTDGYFIEGVKIDVKS